MERYYKIIVVEIVLTAGFGITAWRDTLHGKEMKTPWRETWRLTSGAHVVGLWIPFVVGTLWNSTRVTGAYMC